MAATKILGARVWHLRFEGLELIDLSEFRVEGLKLPVSLPKVALDI